VSLECAKIDHCFSPDTVFTREEVAKGKPAPDLFLHAAAKMDVDPSKCIVVEDAASGIEAAIAAGMKVQYMNLHTKPK
jgi:HAD superfamily hydrolase (TIGR01509 family)